MSRHFIGQHVVSRLLFRNRLQRPKQVVTLKEHPARLFRHLRQSGVLCLPVVLAHGGHNRLDDMEIPEILRQDIHAVSHIIVTCQAAGAHRVERNIGAQCRIYDVLHFIGDLPSRFCHEPVREDHQNLGSLKMPQDAQVLQYRVQKTVGPEFKAIFGLHCEMPEQLFICAFGELIVCVTQKIETLIVMTIPVRVGRYVPGFKIRHVSAEPERQIDIQHIRERIQLLQQPLPVT